MRVTEQMTERLRWYKTTIEVRIVCSGRLATSPLPDFTSSRLNGSYHLPPHNRSRRHKVRTWRLHRYSDGAD